jgi:dTDP-D-glucose 4,6-dehydratase
MRAGEAIISNQLQPMHILITGGAGFIGSHVVRHFLKSYPAYTVTNLDKLTYAGNLANLRDIESNDAVVPGEPF